MARVSIVVASFGGPPVEALASIAEQADPAVEVVQVDAAPGAVGQALSEGFARATGDVFGYLLPGERMLPGAIAGVRRSIEGFEAVLGDAVLELDDFQDVRVPHPAEYLGLVDYLAVWRRRFDSVPRASLFWRREVAERIGPFADGAPFVVDYDLVCRIGARSAIRKVGEPWAAIRLEPVSDQSESDMLQTLIAVSRSHWGPWHSPRRWHCAASYRRYLLGAHERARHHARRAEQAAAQGRPVTAALRRALTWMWSPAVGRGRFGR